jgi:trk system potassium uptake protein TrkH
MTAMTTVGFNTVSIGALSKATLLVVIVLMVIGSSPAGTGGGLKCTTFTAILGVMRGAARGEKEARFWGRAIPADRVWAAVATLGFYVVTLLTGTYLLELTQSTPFESNFFEAASALGTVGLSMGITPGLTDLGKFAVIALMFCGRVGPLSLGTALFGHVPGKPKAADADLAI